MIRIEEARAATPELEAALARLVPQLSSSAPAPGLAELAEIAESAATRLLVARDGGEVVGARTLAGVRIPARGRAGVEDVVVAESARGRGVGEALTREALRLAADAGARSVELTSRPSREAANALYRKLGFEQRETNVYRYTLADEP